MPLGFIPARGKWEYRTFNTASAATFPKGALVMFDGARNLIEFTSASSQYLGIAMSHSTASLPAGQVVVGVPAPGCTAYCDVIGQQISLTGLPASDLSLGEQGCVQKVGNYMSFYTNQTASIFSNIVEIVGPPSSADSRIEVAFVGLNAAFYSVSSVTMA